MSKRKPSKAEASKLGAVQVLSPRCGCASAAAAASAFGMGGGLFRPVRMKAAP